MRCRHDELLVQKIRPGTYTRSAWSSVVKITWERCARVSRQMIETAPFCTTLLERTLDVQVRLEESVPKQHGCRRSLPRRLTEVHEASAGLSGNESPSVGGTSKAPAVPRRPSMPTPGQAFHVRRLPSASPSRRQVHRRFPSVEIPHSIKDRESSIQVAVPLPLFSQKPRVSDPA